MKVTLELESIDAVLLQRYLNLAISQAEEWQSSVTSDSFYEKFPNIIDNARFDVEHSTRLKAIVSEAYEAFKTARGW